MATQDQVSDIVRQFCLIYGWSLTETSEGSTKRFDITQASKTAVARVYSTGTLQLQGQPSELHIPLERLKDLIAGIPDLAQIVLLRGIKASFTGINSKYGGVDPTILNLIKESLVCLEANAVSGGTILLGCASERAIRILIDAYAKAISDPTNRHRFIDQTAPKYISRAYEALKQSMRSCKNKTEIEQAVHDWEAQLDAFFTFYRVCRNDVGHPIVPLNLDRSGVTANLGQFAKYIEVIYTLIGYFNTHPERGGPGNSDSVLSGSLA